MSLDSDSFGFWGVRGAAVCDEHGNQLAELSIGQTVVMPTLFGETAGIVTSVAGDKAIAENGHLFLPLFRGEGGWRCEAAINRNVFNSGGGEFE